MSLETIGFLYLTFKFFIPLAIFATFIILYLLVVGIERFRDWQNNNKKRRNIMNSSNKEDAEKDRLGQ